MISRRDILSALALPFLKLSKETKATIPKKEDPLLTELSYMVHKASDDEFIAYWKSRDWQKWPHFLRATFRSERREEMSKQLMRQLGIPAILHQKETFIEMEWRFEDSASSEAAWKRKNIWVDGRIDEIEGAALGYFWLDIGGARAMELAEAGKM